MAETVDGLFLVTYHEERVVEIPLLARRRPQRFYERVLQRIGILEFVYHDMFEFTLIFRRGAQHRRGVIDEVGERERVFPAPEFVPTGPADGADTAQQRIDFFLFLCRRERKRHQLDLLVPPFRHVHAQRLVDRLFYFSARYRRKHVFKEVSDKFFVPLRVLRAALTPFVQAAM